MNVSDVDKLALATELLPMIVDRLAEKATDHDVTADDIVDFLAIGIAAVIDNDTQLATPQQRRKAVDGVGRRITGQTKALAEYRTIHAQSFLSALLNGARLDGEQLGRATH